MLPPSERRTSQPYGRYWCSNIKCQMLSTTLCLSPKKRQTLQEKLILWLLYGHYDNQWHWTTCKSSHYSSSKFVKKDTCLSTENFFCGCWPRSRCLSGCGWWPVLTACRMSSRLDNALYQNKRWNQSLDRRQKMLLWIPHADRISFKIVLQARTSTVPAYILCFSVSSQLGQISSCSASHGDMQVLRMHTATWAWRTISFIHSFW